MRIEAIDWLDSIVDKLLRKHGVETLEVEQALGNTSRIRLVGRARKDKENLYMALGQTDAGRYLAVFFVRKHGRGILVVSARDMTRKERRQYDHK